MFSKWKVLVGVCVTCPSDVGLRDEDGLVVWRRGCFSICLPPRPFHVNMVYHYKGLCQSVLCFACPSGPSLRWGASGLVGVVFRGGCRVYIVMFLMVNRVAHMF